jgi:hypothetical protein
MLPIQQRIQGQIQGKWRKYKQHPDGSNFFIGALAEACNPRAFFVRGPREERGFRKGALCGHTNLSNLKGPACAALSCRSS